MRAVCGERASNVHIAGTWMKLFWSSSKPYPNRRKELVVSQELIDKKGLDQPHTN